MNGQEEKQLYECLACGHRFYVRKTDSRLSKPRQCGKCWSYDVFPVEEIEELVAMTIRRKKEALIGEMLPLLDTVAVVIRERGLHLTPISTIRLIKKVWQEAVREG